jgi:xanthine dehydrogenase accessory factor
MALGPQLGQCCGGVVWLLFESVRDAAWCAAVQDHVRAERACVIATVLDPGGARRPRLGATLVITGAGTVDGWGEPALEAEVVRAARRLLGGGQVATTLGACGRAILLDPVTREPPIVVFGAGHVGRALVSILGTLPCRVRWIDGRAEEFPPVLAENITVEVSDAPEEEVAAAQPGSSFVVMTHSHELDFAISARILRRGDFAYFGLIGSTAKRRRFERRLQLRGIGAEAVARMRCPVGISGPWGKHPGEIAVAVAAELLQVRSRRMTAIGAPATDPAANPRAVLI